MIESPEVRQKRQKEFMSLFYLGLDKYRGRRRHISTRPVRGICEFQLVKSLLEGRLSAVYQGKHTRRRLEDFGGSVHLPPKNLRRAVRGDERKPLTIQFDVLRPSQLHGPFTWLCLSINQGDPPKVIYVVDSRHSANGASFRKGLVGDIHYRGEALGGKLA